MLSIDRWIEDGCRPCQWSLLTDRVVERVLTETCFVGGVITRPADAMDVDSSGPPGTNEEDAHMLLLCRQHGSTSTAKDVTLSIRHSSFPDTYGQLLIPGWIREQSRRTPLRT